MNDDQHARWLRYLDEQTQYCVKRDGPAPLCDTGCRMIGMPCPDGWCEATYCKLKLGPIVNHPSSWRRIWDWLWEPRISAGAGILGAIIAETLRRVFP
jgi:hypothetical protein